VPSFTDTIFFAAVTIGSYAALCALSPYGVCRRCGGFGFKVRQNRRGRIVRGRQCRRCKGYGQRLRLGRALYNAAARLRREASR
jgi:hypothetical protein